MKVLKLRLLLLSISVLFSIVASAAAQGVIVPGPCERCPRPPRPITLPRSLPIKSIKIDTKIFIAGGDDPCRTNFSQRHRRDAGGNIPLSDSRTGIDYRVCYLGWRPPPGRRSAIARRSPAYLRRNCPAPTRSGFVGIRGQRSFQASIFPDSATFR